MSSAGNVVTLELDILGILENFLRERTLDLFLPRFAF